MMSELTAILKSNQQEFAAVVPFDQEKDKLAVLDFTAANKDLTDDILNDIRAFYEYINHQLQNKNARYGIGGYTEHRNVYSRSKLFDGSPSPLELPGKAKGRSVARLEGEIEARRLHLGVDIWGKPNTAVIAPLDGIVHSFAFNNQPGDYGATIILSHYLQEISFHTLYGHLSLNAIKNIREGDRVVKGDIFAEFGIPIENGHWPPHLHFQIINDLEGWNGDYPGVCKYSEREKYLENCPDPDLILQMTQYL